MTHPVKSRPSAPEQQPHHARSSANRLLLGLARLHHFPCPGTRQRYLQAALDAGFRAFDVAPAYGSGVAERELSRVLPGIRDQLSINTKVGIPVWIYPRPARLLFPAFRAVDKLSGHYDRCFSARDFDDRTIAHSVESSLRRLGTDYIDTLFLHEPLAPFDASTRESLLARADRLRDEGKIRAFGIAGPLRLWDGPREWPANLPVQCPIQDVLAGDRKSELLDRDLTLYGAYRAFLTRAGRTASDYAGFVHDALSSLPRARIIVATSNIHTLRAFGQW